MVIITTFFVLKKQTSIASTLELGDLIKILLHRINDKIAVPNFIISYKKHKKLRCNILLNFVSTNLNILIDTICLIYGLIFKTDYLTYAANLFWVND